MTRDAKPRFLYLGLLVLLALGLAACSGRPATEVSSEAGPEADGNVEAEKFAPDFSLEDLAGNVFRLSDTEGQVRLVDFWATWCAPCREEIPMFKDLHERYGDQGFSMVAVSMDDGPKIVREFVEEYEIPYVNLLGTEQVADDFGGVPGLPTAFLLDRDGRIVKQYFGAKPPKMLEKQIRELLGLESV